MNTATTAQRSFPPVARHRSRFLATTLLAAVAVVCSFGLIASPVAAGGSNLDDAHVTVGPSEVRRHLHARRIRRGAHPVRPQARRRSRCLAHASRPVHQRPRFVEPATGPPVHRGPPTA